MLINLRKLPVSERRLYRAGFYNSTNLHDFKINDFDTIVDFRGDDIDRSKLSEECHHDNIIYTNLPMQNAGDLYRKIKYPKESDLLNFYYELISNHRKEYSLFVNIALCSQKLLYGCYFGKDRTGIASYLLMRYLSIENKITKIDYNASQQWLSTNIDVFEQNWIKKGVSKNAYIDRLRCNPVNIDAIEMYINNKYGSIDKYLMYDCE